MALQTLLLLALTEFVICITPGPAVLLVSSYGFKSGWGASLTAGTGIETGDTVYLLISATGLGAILAASGLAFEILKWTGAAYLIYLGTRTIIAAGKNADDTARLQRLDHPYVRAVITQLGNPKSVLFYAALLPQFLDPHRPLWPQYAEMWAVVTFVEYPVLAAYGLLAAQGKRFVHPRFAAWRERVSGAMMIGVGAIFATMKRAV